jgi:hypothetical protein
MLHNNKIDPWDEALRLTFLEAGCGTEAWVVDTRAAMVMASESAVPMPNVLRQKLFHQLAEVMQTQSLGEVLVAAREHRAVPVETIAEQTALPINIIHDLEADGVYPNNVPIVLLNRLLSALSISFRDAEKGIRRTYELLRGRASLDPFGGLSPAFKKSGETHSSRDALSRPGSGGSKELFQNEEALNRYLSRLEELMNQKA